MKQLIAWFFVLLVPTAHAQTQVTLEGGFTWQTRNAQRIPGDGGTEFDMADFDKGPFTTYRLYAGHIWNGKHELRALYAPLEFEVNGQFQKTVRFQDTVFGAYTDTTLFYKFNSYRLTYAYHFDKTGEWELALGFTGKVRDAEVKVSQGSMSESKSNTGFVPLVNFQARRALGFDWALRFDLDGLAAPQGRAFDAALLIDRAISENFTAYAGLRTIEGGADNKEVYNFAWFYSGVLGARGQF